MTTTSQRETAKIYQFPIGGRTGLRRDRAVAQPAETPATTRVSKAVFSGSWYHEEAIRDSEQAGQR